MPSSLSPATPKLNVRRHSWGTPREGRVFPFQCNCCKALYSTVGYDSPCLIATSKDPAIDKLLWRRRKLAGLSDGSGMKASRAIFELEALESELRRLDQDGDWRFEGNSFDGRGWVVAR